MEERGIRGGRRRTVIEVVVVVTRLWCSVVVAVVAGISRPWKIDK